MFEGLLFLSFLFFPIEVGVQVHFDIAEVLAFGVSKNNADFLVHVICNSSC